MHLFSFCQIIFWFLVFCVCFSISSTLMDMESTASSGRSTPAMLNGHTGGVAGSGSLVAGGKSLSYTCCWDHCQLLFPSSPDLAEHIRATHVDGQRGGVSDTLLCVLVSDGWLEARRAIVMSNQRFQSETADGENGVWTQNEVQQTNMWSGVSAVCWIHTSE